MSFEMIFEEKKEEMDRIEAKNDVDGTQRRM